jgi:uncharacterized YigZ family protein
VFIPLARRSAELKIRKSLFLSNALPVASEEEARELIRRKREEHPKCSHVVWAYILGEENSQRMGMSDDGEPHGTAGKPALSTLQYSGLTNILVTVVRYFGGTKLGTGGLVKAYTDAVKAVIDEMPRRALREELSLGLTFAYTSFDGVRKTLERYGARTGAESFETEVKLSCTVEAEQAEALKKALLEVTSGNVRIE